MSKMQNTKQSAIIFVMKVRFCLISIMLVLVSLFQTNLVFSKSSDSAVKTTNGIFNFLNNKVVGELKISFCGRYLRDIKNGSYISSIREKVGRTSCVGYSSYINDTPKVSTKDQPNLPSTTNATSTKISVVSVINKAIEVVENVTKPVEVKKESGNDYKNALIEIDKIDKNINSISQNNFSSQIYLLTNIERQKLGLSNLVEIESLDNIAKVRMADMFDKGYFDHISPEGTGVSDIAKSRGYNYISIGENIAIGNFSSAKEIVDAWMASVGHKENILRAVYTDIGISVAEKMFNGANMYIAVQVFGKPQLSCAYPDVSIKNQIESFKAAQNDLLIKANTLKSSLDSSSNLEKIDQYNLLAKLVNTLNVEIKNLVEKYNQQVSVYNTCVNN